jgi:outer membrane protein assembly factor BamB
MKKGTLLIIGLLVMSLAPLLLAGETLAADYPSKGVDYIHRGVANIKNEPEFVFLWRAKVLGTTDEFSGPIAVGNKVWIANKLGDNIFRCLELKTGSLIWSYQLNTGADAAPLWFDNKIYIATGCGASAEEGNLYAFNADNGDLLWQRNGINNTGYGAGPWINTDNRIIYWRDGLYLRAMNADNGDLIWSTNTGQNVGPYTGVYYNGITYTPQLIRAYNAENGDFLWSLAGDVWDSGITVDNENADNVVLYVGSHGPAKVWSVNPDNGDVYWKKSVAPLSYVLTVLAVWENKIYGGGVWDGPFFCLRKDNGDYVWQGDENEYIEASPTILPSGKVVYANNDGFLRVRDANNGALIWQYYIEPSYCGQFAVVDNYMLVCSDAGYLWCFGAGNVPPNKPSSLLVTGLTTTTPRFSSVFTDNDLGDSTRYAKVRIGTTDGGSDIWLSDWVSINTTENNQRSDNVTSIALAQETKTYYAQMKFKDNAGNESPWSDSTAFKLTWFPTATNLLAEGQVSPQRLTTFTPNFSFHYIDNVDDNSSIVHFQVGTSAGDNSMWDSQQVKNVENGATISITYAGIALQRGVQYFWRARVRDNENVWSDWSDNENFRINQLPTVENQKVEGQVNPTTFTPTLSWNYSDNDNDNQSDYQIQVGTAENDNSMWDNTGAALTQITYSGNALARGVTYHVRVRAKDNYEWGTWVSGTFKLSPSPTVTVGDRTIVLRLVDVGDTLVIPTSTFTMRLTIRTRADILLIYYARIEEPPQIPTTGIVPFYFDISTSSPDAIGDMTITFDIPKSWVRANDIIPPTLVAWRNSNGIWQTLPSRLVGEDLLYYYLEATTSGFSLFGVSGQKNVVAPTELPTGASTSQTPLGDQQTQQAIFIATLGILITSVMLLISTFRHHKRRK